MDADLLHAQRRATESVAMRRFAHRNVRDANHTKVVGWYTDLGIGVVDLADVGKGCPDLMVHAFGLADLVEIKIEGGKMKESQEEFMKEWHGPLLWLVRGMPDVVDHVRDMYRRSKLLEKAA